MSINERVKMIMEREQLTSGAFAEKIGVVPSTISHILTMRNKQPSTDVILKLHQCYPDISLEWILTGEGPMSTSGTGEPTPAGHPATAGDDYPLFAENAADDAAGTGTPENRREMPLEGTPSTPKEIVRQEIIYKERPPRKITEIRIFFDDNTYETFKPEK